MTVLIPIAIFAALGIISGAALTAASKVFEVKEDKRITEINDALPQANCGGCGYSGCADYAAAVVERGADCNLCRPGGDATAARIAAIMGKEARDVVELTAFVRCSGDCDATPNKYLYDGIQSCAACNMYYNGSKLCTSGCLGYGDCVNVCPTGAIRIKNRIAVVDHRLCIGCGLCATACPNKLIAIRPSTQKVEVLCSSKDTAKDTKKICPNGCVGCKLCEKNCPSEAIKVINNHAVIDYDLCTNCGTCVEVCKFGAVKTINHLGTAESC